VLNRRDFLQPLIALPFAAGLRGASAASASRPRPGDPDWPSSDQWERLNRATDGRLFATRSPLRVCADDPDGASCHELFKALKNPYAIGDDAALTQTCGWLDAWTARPSAYAVAAETTGDVVAAVNFAREHNLRLVIKGGGHSYLGTSTAPDSLLIWTHRMNSIVLRDDFVPSGCAPQTPPQAAVTIGAGAIWMHAYNEVTTKAARYVQGGGCGTVGVAGLIQGGGFGSYSKRYGIAAASLLEAEAVTADGQVRIANACVNPDLFWALKGGGGGGFGVVTRVTLRTHDLPAFFGGVFFTVQASSDVAFRRLIGRFVAFYSEALFNPNWGEIASLRRRNQLVISMSFQDLGQTQAEAVWQPFIRWISEAPDDFQIKDGPNIVAANAQHRWDPAFFREHFPSAVRFDDRPGAPGDNMFWSANLSEAGHFIHGFESTWLPASLLQPDQQERLADALCAAAARWSVEVHFQKGLAGAPAAARTAAAETAMNPAVLDAFALAIIAGEGPPVFPGLRGHEPDLPAARRNATRIAAAMDELLKVVPNAGAYVAESSYFQQDWQRAYWGPHYQRLLAIKRQYDPDGLFFTRHGVGSEGWTEDGFTRLSRI
jgi:FAD/FMN-containing dehydrogenase